MKEFLTKLFDKIFHKPKEFTKEELEAMGIETIDIEFVEFDKFEI